MNFLLKFNPQCRNLFAFLSKYNFRAVPHRYLSRVEPCNITDAFSSGSQSLFLNHNPQNSKSLSLRSIACQVSEQLMHRTGNIVIIRRKTWIWEVHEGWVDFCTRSLSILGKFCFRLIAVIFSFMGRSQVLESSLLFVNNFEDFGYFRVSVFRKHSL